jgi:hypothetical protein
MTQNRKGKKLWKWVWGDANIIFVGLSLMQALNLVNTIEQFSKGATTLLKVILDSVVLLSVIGAFIFFFQRIRKLAKQLETKQLPVCFVVNKTPGEAQQNFEKLKSAITELTGFSTFDKIEGFSTRFSCLIPQERNYMQPEIPEWKGYINHAIESIKSFANSIVGNKVYHIALDVPATMALGIGAVFSTKHPLVVYRWDGKQYLPVLNLVQDPRMVKEHLPEGHQYRYFRITYPEKYKAEVAVVLGAASHEAVNDVKKYLETRKMDMSLVVAENTYAGNLTETEWLPAIRELFSLFTHLAKTQTVSEYHVFYSIPVALGFGLGMALGQFKPVTLYNWEKDQATYYPVLKLNELGVTY